jgi:hypothetical protein
VALATIIEFAANLGNTAMAVLPNITGSVAQPSAIGPPKRLVHEFFKTDSPNLHPTRKTRPWSLLARIASRV